MVMIGTVDLQHPDSQALTLKPASQTARSTSTLRGYGLLAYPSNPA